MKILSTLLLLVMSFSVCAQCLVPIRFKLDCENDGPGFGTVTTSIGGTFNTDVTNSLGATIIEGSSSGIVEWTFQSSAPFNNCENVSGEIAPCNTYIDKDIIKNVVDCEANHVLNTTFIENSEISVLNKLNSSAIHTNLSTNQYVAGGSICLDSGFEVNQYTSFHAFIDDCTLENNFMLECTGSDASIWFGGDDRSCCQGRDVGAGQGIKLDRNVNLQSFEILLGRGFEYFSTNTPYNGSVELKLDIRNGQSEDIANTTTTVSASFSGGWVTFDLSDLELTLLGDRLYIFTWYIVDGQTLEITSSSVVGFDYNLNRPSCSVFGFNGNADLNSNTSLDDWDSWFAVASSFYNIRLHGSY